MDLQKLLATFMLEARECLDQLEHDTLALAEGLGDETLPEIFRRLHTLKGGASCVGLEALTRAAHHVEDAVGCAQQTGRGTEPALAGLLLHAIDVFASLLADVPERDDPSDPRIAGIADRCARWIAAIPSAPTEQAADVSAAPVAAPTRTIRVEVSRLDRAMELAGGLTVARGRLANAVASRDLQRTANALEAADALIRSLELQILELRLVPLRVGFERLRRAVRDVGNATGKEVRLELRCDDLEVDVAVADALRDPLTHLVRNAIDHGIELPEERVRRGKSRYGTITLVAYHAGGELVVEVRDDGDGFDREELVARAEAMGISGEGMTDDQIFELAFIAGLSTARSVGDLSGRGIGMDVVRRTIETLRGSVRLRSERGRGSTVTIRLPLALSFIHGLAVGVGEEVFVLPVDSVAECVELDREHAIRSAHGGVLELRGEALPYVRLADHFGAPARAAARSNVVVVDQDESRAGIEVDALIGEVQTVIKPMGTLFRSVAGIAGSAVLGDGRIALVVDVRAVMRSVASRPTA